MFENAHNLQYTPSQSGILMAIFHI